MTQTNMSRPLTGVHIVEFAALGPAPFAAMTLSDLGAKVTRIVRVGAKDSGTFLARGREDMALDLTAPEGVAAAKALVAGADAVIEGLRPGKMEKLGLGPRDLAEVNPRLVYGRSTGWGQTGPMAALAGHDINFLGLTGVLDMIGTPDRPPVPPLNLIADFGGGGMYLALGIVSAVMAARASGQGAAIDAGMVHGTTHLASFVHGWDQSGQWRGGRGGNMLDGGAPFYRCYVCADGLHMAVGAIEPVFFAAVVRVLELDERYLATQMDQALWPEMALDFAAVFARETRDHWVRLFDGIDACVTPVLSLAEAKAHPQMAGSFAERDGVVQPKVAPKISPLS